MHDLSHPRLFKLGQMHRGNALRIKDQLIVSAGYSRLLMVSTILYMHPLCQSVLPHTTNTDKLRPNDSGASWTCISYRRWCDRRSRLNPPRHCLSPVESSPQVLSSPTLLPLHKVEQLIPQLHSALHESAFRELTYHLPHNRRE